MFKSLKSKLVILTSILIIFLLIISAIILIEEKTNELSKDIYLRGKAYAELSSQEIVNAYEELLKEGGFVLFNVRIRELFSLNEDITDISLTTFEGNILYDSMKEKNAVYEGPTREIRDTNMLNRIQAKNISFYTARGRTVFLKRDGEETYTVDLNERLVPEIGDDEQILSIVIPYKSKYAVVYNVGYHLLNDRVARTTQRIILLTIFGVMIGIAVSVIAARHVTAPLTKLKETVSFIARGNFKTRVNVKSQDEVGSLADSVNNMARDLELSTKALVYKERVAKELELAAKLQERLIPKDLPKVEGLDIGAGILAAAEVGGDLYDFIPVSENNLLSYIGDVTGHGVPSGILGAIANALIYGYSGNIDIKDILIETNRILHVKSTQNMFLTMIMSSWNKMTGEFRYVNAGHEQILHYDNQNKKITMLPRGGIALGMINDVSKMLKIEQIKPNKGDIVVMYTDGIPEAKRDRMEMYGMDRFIKAMGQLKDLESAEAIKNAIMADVRHFIDKYKQLDDITLIVYKWT